MARATFGGTANDFAFDVTSGGFLKLAHSSLSFWDAETGGNRYADLLVGGATASTVTVPDDGQIPEFQGPDGVTEMWADGGAGRVLIRPSDAVPSAALDARMTQVAQDTSSAFRAQQMATFVAPAGILAPSGDTTGATDLARLNALIAAAMPDAGTIVVQPGHYYFKGPIVIKGTNTGANNVPCPVPSLVGLGAPGQIGDMQDTSSVIFEATADFPLGSFLLDYQQAVSGYGNSGAVVKGITMRCKARAAGMRMQGARQFFVGPLAIINAAAPVNPGDGATGAFSVTRLNSNSDGGAYNTFTQVVVDRAAQDSFCEYDTRDLNTYVNCQSLSPTRNNYYLYGSDAEFVSCGYESGTTAVYADLSTTSKLFGLHTYAGSSFPLTGNAVVIVGGFGATGIQYPGPKFYGCEFGNAPAAGVTEQAGAVVNITEYTSGLILGAMFHGCLFFAHANTTDWFYVEGGLSGAVQVSDCEFKGTVTGSLWNDQSGVLEFARCNGLTVPTTGAVAATADLVLGDAQADVPGATVDLFTPKGRLIVDATFDLNNATANDTIVAVVNIDGTDQQHQLILAGAVNRICLSRTIEAQLQPGSHTIKLRAMRIGSSTVTKTNTIHTGFTYRFTSDVS